MSDSTAALACTPNFSAAGRRRRLQGARLGAIITLTLAAGFVLFDASWPMRLSVMAPAALMFVSGLQVRRNTCVAHAATGMFENDDFSTEKVDAARAAASRRVAATIWRDSLLGSAAVGALSVASAFIL